MKITPRTKQKIWPADEDGNPYIYVRGNACSIQKIAKSASVLISPKPSPSTPQ